MRMSLASFSARLAGHDQFLCRFCTENVAKTRQISTFFGVKAANLVRKSVHKLGRSSPQRSMRSCMSFSARWAGHEQILSRLESKLPRTRAKIAFVSQDFDVPPAYFRRKSRQQIGADSLTVMRMSLASFSARLAGHDQIVRRFCIESAANTPQNSMCFGVKAANFVRKSVQKLCRSSPKPSMRS